MTTVLDVLHEALGRIETDGWCQGYAVGQDGSVCALYAIESEAGCDIGDSWRDPTPEGALAREAVAAVLAAAGVAATPRQMVDWNDAEGRTVEEVIAAFRGAIARMEGAA